MSNWTPRPALTENELKNLISSVTDYIKPTTPCAQYEKVMYMKNRYEAVYGTEQLKKDWETVQRSLDGYRKSRV